jgi:hypothetical protein
VVVNEFSRLAGRELQTIDDPRLWLLLSTGALEVSRASPPLRRSTFARFVVAGLRGAAARGGSRVVTLDDLYRFVHDGVADAATRESGGRETQFPGLFQGTVGQVVEPPALALVPASPHTLPAAAETSAKPAAAAAAPGLPAASGHPLRKLLDDAWSLRDRAGERQADERWTPTDWAPHLWTEYQQLLLGYELRYRAGTAYREDELAERLKSDILPLRDLLDRGTLPAGMENSTVLARLAAARQQFLAARLVPAEMPHELQIVARAIHLRDDLIARSREYVRWHALASRRSAQTLPLFEPLREMLESRLPELIALVETFQATDAGEAAVPADRSASLKNLSEQLAAVEALRGKIENEGFQPVARDLLGNAAIKDRAAAIDALLATTILPAPLRRQLLDALENVARPADAPPEPPTADEAAAVARQQLRRLAEHCRLEAALAGLGDAAVAARVRQAAPTDGGPSEETMWQTYRAVGKLLGTFYRELPTQIRGDLAASPPVLGSGARQLRLVDARDAAKVDDAGALLAWLRLPHLAAATSVAATRPVPPPLAAPDVVDLVVEGTGITVDDRGPTAAIRLRPFPNRSTAFRFALVNRSRRPRAVTAELFALPGWHDSLQTGGTFPLDTLGNAIAGLRKLYAVEVALPAEDRAVPIPWPQPKAPQPSGKPGANESAGPPAAWPAVTLGLACVVRDVAAPERKWVRAMEFAPLAPRDYLDPLVSYTAAGRRILVEMRPRQHVGDGRPNVELLPPLAPGESIPVVWETAGLMDPDTEMNDRAEIAPPAYAARLFAEVTPRPGRRVPVRLTVDGYPRAFVYEVQCDQDWDRVERERSLRRAQIVAPAENAAFRAPLDRLPVRFQVDAPEDAFQDPGDVVQIGIDESGLRRLASRVEFHADRQIEVTLEEPLAPGILRFATRVDDFGVSLSPGGLRNKKVELVARLLLSNRSISSERLAAEGSVGVVLDGAPPELEVDTPTLSVAQGEPLAVTARTADLSGVVKVEFGFDLDGSGDLEEKEKPKVLRQPDGQRTTWTIALPTQDLEPGQYILLVRATDRVGLVTKRSQSATVLAASKPAATPAPTAATIEGRVVLVDRPCPNFSVQLDSGDQTATTDDDGRFVFKDVPPGKHTLHAKGAALNRFREGSAAIVTTASLQPASVVIRLE